MGDIVLQRRDGRLAHRRWDNAVETAQGKEGGGRWEESRRITKFASSSKLRSERKNAVADTPIKKR